MKRLKEYFIKVAGLLLSLPMFLMAIILYLIPPIQIFLLMMYLNKKKNRLNNHYTFSYHKKQDRYYLHHSPVLILNYTKSTDFYRYREKAVEKFKREHPNVELYAETMTLQNY